MELLKHKITLTKALELIQLYIEEQLTFKDGEIVPYPMIIGSPGIGKSSMISSLAKELGFEVKTEHVAMRPLEYFSGIPELVKTDDELLTRWSKPEFINLPKDKTLVWFLDDFHLVEPGQAKYFFEILTYRSLQNYRIPDNVVIVLAGNNSSKSGFRNMLSPVVNRLAMFSVKNSIEDWFQLYVNRVPLKECIKIISLRPEKVEVDPLVIAFMERYNEYVVEEEDNQKPFGTLRSWTFFGRIMQRYRQHFSDRSESEKKSDLIALAMAHVSEKASSAFMNFYQISEKFDPNKMIEEGILPRLSDDQTERSTEVFSFMLMTTKYFADKYAELVGKSKSADAEKLFDNYVKLFNFLVNLSNDTPGTTGVLVRSLSYLKKKFEEYGLTQNLRKRFKMLEDSKDRQIFDRNFIEQRYNLIAQISKAE